MIKHISCDCKCKFDSTTCNFNQKSNNKTCQRELNYCTSKNDYSWNPSMCICENGKYLKHIADTSVIVHDEIINATDSVSANVTNTTPTNKTSTISANVVSTMSVHSDGKMDCYGMNG